MIDFLKYIPINITPRKVQSKILSQDFPKAFEDYQIIVINTPVASGKSILAATIAKAVNVELGWSTAICAPTVMLQDQYQREFDTLPSLKGKERYSCQDADYETCHDKSLDQEKYCTSCPYKRDRDNTLIAPSSIFNLYSYLFLSSSETDENVQPIKDVVILDEAQAIISQLRELYTIKFWQHKDNYPENISSQGDLCIWLEGQVKLYESQLSSLPRKEKEALNRLKDKLIILIQGMKSNPGSFYYEYKKEYYRHVLKDCLFITPFTMKGLTSKLQFSKKLILMSATISSFDLEELGLSDKRVKYIDAESEIPFQNRPILFMPAYKASYKFKGEYEPKLANVLKKLLRKHPTKGLIHVTYDMIEPLKALLEDEPRLLWHSKIDKEEKYKEFRQSTDKVLIAAGMAEGVDLAGSEFGWQVISKLVFPSLGNGLVKRQKENSNKWYSWQVCKSVIQQSGRICRAPTDYGITYIFDSNFIGLYYGYGKEFFPKYFKQAVEEGRKIIAKDYKDFLK